MKKLFTPVVTLALATAALTGCKTHEGAYTPVSVPEADLENTQKFVLLDPGAQRSITTSGPIQEKWLPDGRLQVSTNVRNRENRRIQVQVDCVFKDEQGFPLDQTPFQNLILTENSQEGVTFTAMNTNARKYTIRVREAR